MNERMICFLCDYNFTYIKLFSFKYQTAPIPKNFGTCYVRNVFNVFECFKCLNASLAHLNTNNVKYSWTKRAMSVNERSDTVIFTNTQLLMT